MKERTGMMVFSNIALKNATVIPNGHCRYIETRTLRRDRRLFGVLVVIDHRLYTFRRPTPNPKYELFLGALGQPSL